MLWFHPANNAHLNYDYPSVYGPVDVSWMLDVSVGAAVGGQQGATGLYLVAKPVWNLIKKPFVGGPIVSSIFSPANFNTTIVATKWVREGEGLRTIFRPALEECGERDRNPPGKCPLKR